MAGLEQGGTLQIDFVEMATVSSAGEQEPLMNPSRKANLVGLRIAGGALLLPGLYILHMWRTSGEGWSGIGWPAIPILAAFNTLIPSLLLCVGTRGARYAARVLALNALILLASDAVARFEEHMFVRACQRSELAEGETQFRTSRWWPFEHHALFYNPETRSLVGTD